MYLIIDDSIVTEADRSGTIEPAECLPKCFPHIHLWKKSQVSQDLGVHTWTLQLAQPFLVVYGAVAPIMQQRTWVRVTCKPTNKSPFSSSIQVVTPIRQSKCAIPAWQLTLVPRVFKMWSWEDTEKNE